MRKLLVGLLCALPWLALAAPARGQEETAGYIEHYTLATTYNLNGIAASDARIVASANLVDSTTFTIANQPDVCRLIDMTITDANSSITAGTITVTGTDCLGYARTCVFDFSVVATRGSGVKTIPVTVGPAGSSCYLGSVTSVVSSALTGEDAPGTDLIKVGFTSNSVRGYKVFGKLKNVGPMGEHGVDITAGTQVVGKPITTSGSSSTTITSVGNLSSFANVAVGDLLIFNVQGRKYEALVTARGSANSITVNRAFTIPAAGVPFQYKTSYFTTDPYDEVALYVAGQRSVAYDWSIDANADTGGIITDEQCTVNRTPSWPAGPWVTLNSTTTGSGSTQVPKFDNIDLYTSPYSWCKFSARFGTGDDGDGAPDSLNVGVTLRKEPKDIR